MGEASYFTNIGPSKGPILWRHHFGAIGVYQSREPELGRAHLPIGIATGWPWDDEERKLWRLTVNKHDLPGLWMVADREFVPVRVGTPKSSNRPSRP